jgi:hypothetical protein
MGYNVEISINMLKETKFSEFESTIQELAELYKCDSIYSINEEDGTKKIPRYHCIFVIIFLNENLDNFIKFLKCIRNYRSSYIECIYDNNLYKLLYASSYYLKNIDKEASNNYKKFINEKKFTPNETLLLKEFIK